MMALILVVLAGILQGSFILPLTYVKGWKWEHGWFVFSLLGMVFLNITIGTLYINNLWSIFSNVSSDTLVTVFAFGICWGVGAILFGKGMDMLGMSLGYPIIMGLVCGMGGLLPMLVFQSEKLVTVSGLVFSVGLLVIIFGIILCARAAGIRDNTKSNTSRNTVGAGLVVAILAGVLSALPNIGFSFAQEIISVATSYGNSIGMAGNAVWVLFFSAGFIPNALYTLYLVSKNKTFALFSAQNPVQNIGLITLMSLFWIGSFYIYGISASSMGTLGSIIGWPIFISLSIVVGNILGLWRGEWKGAPKNALSLLFTGIAVLIAAVFIIGLASKL